MSIGINSSYGMPGYVREYMQTPYEKEREAEMRKAAGTETPAEELKEKIKKRCDPNCECETCKNRKYVDGSDEMVSFKSAQHIPKAAVATRVRAHEQEHVSNAYKKAAQDNGKVLQASVAIHTAICPECGRTYVSGGTTTTKIMYYNEDNPYQKDLKLQDASKYEGMNVDTKG